MGQVTPCGGYQFLRRHLDWLEELLPRSILVAFVYENPDKVKRKTLWKDLSRSIPFGDEPWMAIGDFNAILSPDDKKDDHSRGHRYCVVTHLPRIKSDHRPLLLNRPLRFLDRWLKHHSFSDFVKENWNYDGNMINAIASFTDRLKNWNKCVYGCISQQKRNLMHKLSKVQNVVDLSGSKSLRHLELEIREGLESILYHEEILYKQKSRCEWLKLGDRNTSYFHRRTIQRRKFNKNTALRDADGEWVFDQDALKREAVNFFQKLYGEVPGTLGNLPQSAFLGLKAEDVDFLGRIVTNEEIKATLFDMVLSKPLVAMVFKLVFFRINGILLERTYVVLWNGVPTQKFKPVRGIHQGCPLSSYLFVLCMEWLGHRFHSSISVKEWADVVHSDFLMKFLSNFCEISGHKVNARKTNVFFSKGVSTSSRSEINDILGFQEVDDLGHYLGVPLFHKRVTKCILEFLVEKVRSRLSSWDANVFLLLEGAVARAWPLLCNLMIWSIGDGTTVRCWEDSWVLDKGPLKNYALRNGSFDPNTTVSEMVLPNGDWNLNLFKLWLPENIVERIISIPSPMIQAGPDCFSWLRTTSGIFSVKSAYYALKEDSWYPQELKWKMIWKIPSPHRVKHFIWLILKQRLLTNSEKVRRGIEHGASCLSCGHSMEDTLHIFRDCPYTKEILHQLIPASQLRNFFSILLSVWLISNLQLHSLNRQSDCSWPYLFGIILWRLWKNQNSIMFQGNGLCPRDVINASYSWAKHFLYTSTEEMGSQPIQHSFQQNPGMYVFLNTDGAVHSVSGLSAVGGVLRNNKGEWILGFNCFLGKCSPVNVELWGLLDGLRIAQKQGYNKVIIRLDNLENFILVCESKAVVSKNPLIKRIQQILASKDHWHLNYIPRETNWVADALAKMALSSGILSGLKTFCKKKTLLIIPS
ncbi:hypothetical protein PVK06_048052 [Gossypium arboreum]|uniref:Reverse transcriptase n=1 Tax=Gossypium arboreum TaxID=29729 RepID=A0ABR0MF09_GOSAR|nr:hypothetical protein PVK06_048052 [Gossypium arboreum]